MNTDTPAGALPLPAALVAKSPACAKHLFRPVLERAMEKPGPTGHPSGFWGIWQQRRCVYCQHTAARWKPGIHARTVHGANQENRSTSAQLARNWKLEVLERELAANIAAPGATSQRQQPSTECPNHAQ